MQDQVPPTAPTAPIDRNAAAAAPLPDFGRTLGDMRFMGWVTLIYGVLSCLTIVGAVVGVPVIIAAHRFIEGVGRFENWGGSRNEDDLHQGFHELGRSFRILKVITIVYLVLTVLYLVFLFFLGGFALLQGLTEGTR